MRSVVILALGATVTTAALAHHSDSGMDVDTVITIDGTINEFSWRNPHIYFTVESEDANGQSVEWTVQMAGIRSISRMGWSAEILQPGDHVTIDLHPARDGRPYGLFDAGLKEGSPLPTSYDSETGELRFAAPTATGSAPTLEGRWMADGQQTRSYVDGYAGYTQTHLQLTDKAIAEQAAYNMFSDENPEAACLGRPTPAIIFYSDLFPIEIEFKEAEQIVEIRGQFFDEVRTVYMDGRDHPSAETRFHLGHSIGRWEGDTLVVDTRNFTDNRSPYQNGIPSGGQKHVVERYTRADDGMSITVEFTLADPEYIAVPWTDSRQLLYRPDADMSPFNCDAESTRRFLPQ